MCCWWKNTEKKMLMDMAMSGNADFFAQFYTDLADQRFEIDRE